MIDQRHVFAAVHVKACRTGIVVSYSVNTIQQIEWSV